MFKMIFSWIIQPSGRASALPLTLVFLLVWTVGGCGKRMYVPSEKNATSNILINNPIFDSGFYVELDGQEAGFVKDKLELRVTPGRHRLKLFNVETAVTENTTKITHTFNLKVDVPSGETKEIELSWKDPGYSVKQDVRDESMREILERREKAEKKTRENKQGGMPGGVPY